MHQQATAHADERKCPDTMPRDEAVKQFATGWVADQGQARALRGLTARNGSMPPPRPCGAFEIAAAGNYCSREQHEPALQRHPSALR